MTTPAIASPNDVKRNARKTIVAVAAITAVLGFLYAFYVSYRSLADRNQISEANLDGTLLMPPPGYKWESHDETLVIAVHASCRYCQASLPFYRRLVELEATSRLRAHVLAVMPDDKDAGTALLRSGGLTVDSLFGRPLGSIRVSATPTLLLLDSHGLILHAWIGRLTPQRENEVIANVQK